MKIFNTLSFDAIILPVFALFLFMGLYFGFRRQFGLALQLILPHLLLYFLYDEFLSWHLAITGRSLFKPSPHRYLFNALFVYVMAFLCLFFLVGLGYRLFRPSPRKIILERPRLYSRLAGGFFGLVCGFLLSTMLLYFLKPLIGFDYRPPLTKLLVATENKVITLSKLNQYQYVNVSKYRDYDTAISLFTGRSALDFYERTEENILSLPELEAKIKDEIRPLLSPASHDLFGNGTLSELVRRDGSKRIYQKILELEKENANFSIIQETFLDLKSKQAYVALAERIQERGPLSFSVLMETLNAGSGEILSEFPDLHSRREFESGYASGLFFLDNEAAFRKHLPENAGEDLELYVKAFEALLEGEGLAAYAESFLKTETRAYPILAEIFKKYLRYEKTIASLPKSLSFAAKVVLADEAKNWFEAHLWEDASLLKFYLFDALNSSSSRGHKLYSEYFFIEYLASPEGYESFGGAEFAACLEKLEDLVASGLLDRELAERYVANLLLNEESILRDFERKKVASVTLFSEILALEHEYLPESLKTELAKRG